MREDGSPQPAWVARLSGPVTLVACLWVWLGRALFGIEGWWLLLLVMFGWPAVPLLLIPAVAWAVRRHRGRSGEPPAAAIAQVVVWVGLFVLGATLVDYGDAPGSEASVLSRLTGADPTAFSPVFLTAGVLTVLAWLTQIALLLTAIVRDRRQASSRASDGGVSAPRRG